MAPAAPTRCSVCSQGTDGIDASPSSAPGLTCGLCGAVIALRAGDVAPCQVCGTAIQSAADGVKLCDGRIVHAVCGAHRR